MTDTEARRTEAADEARLTFASSGHRQVRPTALGRGTHGVPDVRRLVEAQFHVAFPHRVWVAGQVGRPAGTEDGLRFVLHSSTGQDPYSLPCLVPADGLDAVRALLAGGASLGVLVLWPAAGALGALAVAIAVATIVPAS